MSKGERLHIDVPLRVREYNEKNSNHKSEPVAYKLVELV